MGVVSPLLDPTLSLRDGNGNVIATNDNWKDSQQLEIAGTGLAPSDDNESAIIALLSPGSYTAIVAGKQATTGVGLVEVLNVIETDEFADNVADLTDLHGLLAQS